MAWWLFCLTVALTCGGQTLQKIAAMEWHRRSGGTVTLFRLPAFWVAAVCMGLGAGCWLLLLQRWAVGRAYALLSVNFIVMLLVARFVLHERVVARHWIGVGLIAGGVCMLSLS